MLDLLDTPRTWELMATKSVTITSASALFVDKSRGLVVVPGLKRDTVFCRHDHFLQEHFDSYPDSVRIVSG